MSKNRPLWIEVWDLVRVHKAWFLVPVLFMLLVVGLLITRE